MQNEQTEKFQTDFPDNTIKPERINRHLKVCWRQKKIRGCEIKQKRGDQTARTVGGYVGCMSLCVCVCGVFFTVDMSLSFMCVCGCVFVCSGGWAVAASCERIRMEAARWNGQGRCTLPLHPNISVCLQAWDLQLGPPRAFDGHKGALMRPGSTSSHLPQGAWRLPWRPVPTVNWWINEHLLAVSGLISQTWLYVWIKSKSCFAYTTLPIKSHTVLRYVKGFLRS